VNLSSKERHLTSCIKKRWDYSIRLYRLRKILIMRIKCLLIEVSKSSSIQLYCNNMSSSSINKW